MKIKFSLFANQKQKLEDLEINAQFKFNKVMFCKKEQMIYFQKSQI